MIQVEPNPMYPSAPLWKNQIVYWLVSLIKTFFFGSLRLTSLSTPILRLGNRAPEIRYQSGGTKPSTKKNEMKWDRYSFWEF
jgi:hypothetical protein